MSFEKARNIIDLCTKLSGRYVGLTIDDTMISFGVSRRTAQRMLHLTEEMFHAETYVDQDGRKRWRIRGNINKELVDLSAEEIASVDLAIDLLKRRGQEKDADNLLNLKDKIKALVPSHKAFALETDYEVLLEAQGFAARRGPRPIIDKEVLKNIGGAIKSCHLIVVDHMSEKGVVSKRTVAPYGILYGKRPYLVAQMSGKDRGEMRYFRLDKILKVKISDKYFERDENFNLATFSRKSYSIFQNEKEFAEIEWRFSPKAAKEAKCFLFHPNQIMIEESDGSLTVKFEASGYLEMCWDLYRWGSEVEVVKPKRLRDMCEGHRRSDFYALP